ncbi:hypothetical protein KIH74_15150 [Kineosporia sp. J2-2]|uniref:Glycine zipper domain-containing protein n=1 Tax=Kineosporia corallincola TaxID=2835133 RepID=A0ABS5TGQ4_9ACTN|nr:hypothetical protein [Kineosporia corallincola]MBT0770277.1 hypothetical protein [Kineosporia corallincola]
METIETWDRVGRKLPWIGYGITLTDVGYDLTHGKGVEKTILSATAGGTAGALAGGTTSAVVGFAGAAGAGAATGAAGGSVVPVAGTIVGALIGAGVSLAASGRFDAAYDKQALKYKEEGRNGSVALNTLKDVGGSVEDKVLASTEKLLGDEAADKLGDASERTKEEWGFRAENEDAQLPEDNQVRKAY